MIDIAIALIVLLIVAAASFYIYKAKKSGQKCIGCPQAKKCNGTCPSCHTDEK